jgi:hypothetical protein
MNSDKEVLPPLGTWAQRERRYIVEWAENRYPSARKEFNVPIGPIPQEIIQAMGYTKGTHFFRPWRLKIDCLVYLTDKLVAAEAEIVKPKEALRDLGFYQRMLPQTTELGEWKLKPIEYVLVMPEEIGWVKAMCSEMNVKLDIFRPDWIDQYIEMLEKYFTKEGELERLERRRRLRGY